MTTAFSRQALLGEYRDEYDSLLAWPRTDGGPFADIAREVGRRGGLMQAVGASAHEIDIRPSCMQMLKDLGYTK